MQNANAILVARRRAEEALIEAKDALELKTRELAQSLAMMRATLDPQRIVQAVTDAATEASGAAFGAFFYNVTEQGDAYRLYALSGARREDFDRFGQPRATTLFGPTFRGEGIVRIDEVTQDSRYGQDPPHHGMPRGHRPVKSYLALPVVSRNGEVLGGLFFGHPEAGVFSERHERVVAGIAAQAAIAIDNARLYEAAQRARAQAENTNHVKDEFLATLSHELRTPLNTMLGWVRMLRSGMLDQATARRALEVVERNVDHQSRLITDLLDVSRITSGKLTLEIVAVDLAVIVASVVEAMQPSAAAKSVAITLRATVSVRMDGDPERLRQVVANLLSNAVKFTPKGGSVTVALERTDDHVRLTVSDTGQGIRREFLPYIFERFRQADASSTRTQTGLGLAIARHIVELHEGTISADSGGEGQGTRFTVELPVTKAFAPSSNTVKLSPVSQSAVPLVGALDGMQVLVVDDDTDTRALFTEMLTRQGAKATPAGTVREALAIVRANAPDVIVCDLAMPGDDGFALVRAIRSWPTDQGGAVPVIAVTAYARPEDRERAMAGGFQAHVAKPVEPAELVTAVATIARRVGRPSQ